MKELQVATKDTQCAKLVLGDDGVLVKIRSYKDTDKATMRFSPRKWVS